jgi:predicted RecB family endonuclease
MMFNPGMFGFSPEQMQSAREVGKHLRTEIRKCPREGRLEIRYLAIHPGDTKALETAAGAVDTLAAQLAYMHDTMFGMKGEIINQA